MNSLPEVKDSRPKEYHYYNQLRTHLQESEVFFDRFVKGNFFFYPRQFEIHLPGNHKKACQLNCSHCAGKYFIKDLGYWEMVGLELLDNLKGAIPFHIYGGAYTEPILNPYYLTFLAMTKKYGNHFGIHTNGTLLSWLEEEQGWLTELNRLSTDETDYLSISIDAGTAKSWGKSKGTKNFVQFYKILDGIRKAVYIRNHAEKGHAIRLCYLISPLADSQENFENIVSFAKETKVDSLRFSIPFAPYNQTFEKVHKYKDSREIPGNEDYQKRLAPFLSKSVDDQPYIFYTGPEFTDIDRYTFKKCYYFGYQITLGADGYFYKCSTVATPTAKHCRLEKATSDLSEFHKVLNRNADLSWDCQKLCFEKKLRCNRMGLEINSIIESEMK